MKKIINGKVYDTAKAKLLGDDAGGEDAGGWSERLFQKRTGEYFLHGQGGPSSKYARSVGLNQWVGDQKIIPLDAAAARKWAEEHLSVDAYDAIFGLPDEGAKPVMISTMLPAPLVAAARQRAVEDGVSLTAIVESALSAYLKQ